jgi:hypothetical protein
MFALIYLIIALCRLSVQLIVFTIKVTVWVCIGACQLFFALIELMAGRRRT